MFKKMIALVLCCIMVLPLCSPVFAVPADNDQGQYDSRSMEEILSDYHTKSRQIENQSNAGTYSRSNQTSDTVRQDAVSELKAAGYEAYDVNPDTYASVEAELNTDLSDIGLDPESSYIVVISGENSNANPNSTNGSSRVITLPPHEYENSGSSFQYTYNGVTYTMRYVTVTSAADPNYVVSDIWHFESDYTTTFGERFLSTTISYFVDEVFLPVSTIYSLLGIDYRDDYTYGYHSLVLHATTEWTFRHLQVWRDDIDAWQTSQTSCYVDARSRVAGYVKEGNAGSMAWHEGEEAVERKYSPEYDDTETLKRLAAQASRYNGIYRDSLDYFDVAHEGNILFSLQEPTP